MQIFNQAMSRAMMRWCGFVTLTVWTTASADKFKRCPYSWDWLEAVSRVGFKVVIPMQSKFIFERYQKYLRSPVSSSLDSAELRCGHNSTGEM